MRRRRLLFIISLQVGLSGPSPVPGGMGHIRSWTNAPIKLISDMGNIVLATEREGLQRCRIGLVIVQKIQERSALSGGKRLGHKPRSAHGKLVQPVPHTGGVPGDFYIRGFIRAPLAAALSLHCAGLFAWRIYLCFMEISNLT